MAHIANLLCVHVRQEETVLQMLQECRLDSCKLKSEL